MIFLVFTTYPSYPPFSFLGSRIFGYCVCLSSWVERYLDDIEVSQFDKEAVDIKFDTVEGFLLVDQIIHRKTQTFEVRHSKYTSGTSRIGMRVSEGPPSVPFSTPPILP